jgi:hypothetical protein
MTSFTSVEQAYEVLAEDVLRFIDGRPWDCAGANYRIFNSMISTDWWLCSGGVENATGGGESSIAESKVKSAAVRFLREDLLKATGQRIWGLALTVFPDGKFSIEYDYNKPEGYEETDETIDVSLTDFAAQINRK